MTEIVPSRQARLFGPFVLASGVFGIGFAVYMLATTPGDPAALVLAPSIAAVAALLVSGGWMLALRRGGVAVTNSAFVLFGDSEGDRLEVPFERVRSILVREQVEEWVAEVHRTWVCEAELTGGARVLLAESDDEHALRHVAHRMAAAGAGLGTPRNAPREPAEPARRPPRPAPAAVAEGPEALVVLPGSSGSLARVLLTGGTTMLVVGGILLWHVEKTEVFGFLFGPILLFLGMLLAAVPLVKRGLREHIRLAPGATMTHWYEGLGLTWLRRAIVLRPGASVRIRQRGVHGATLEILSGRTVTCVGGGVHAGTRLDYAGLDWLAQALQHLIDSRRGAMEAEVEPEPEGGSSEVEGS